MLPDPAPQPPTWYLPATCCLPLDWYPPTYPPTYPHGGLAAVWQSAPWRFGLLILAGFGSLTGCGEEQAGDVYDHEEIPAHKPLHFAEGVETLQAKLTLAVWTAEDFGVVMDLVTWLPELAAESDLQEGEWSEINQLVKESQRLLQSIGSATSPNKNASPESVTLSPTERESLQKLFDELAKWCRFRTLHEPIYDGRHSHEDH